MYNRYYELKNIYKNFIIFIKSKYKFCTFDDDKVIVDYLDFKKMKYLKKYKINYIILENLDIIEKNEFFKNKYDEYYIKSKFSKTVKFISERL